MGIDRLNLPPIHPFSKIIMDNIKINLSTIGQAEYHQINTNGKQHLTPDQ